MMDQGVSYEGLKNQKTIKAVMDRQQAMDQGIRYGSRMNLEVMDQGAMIGAMDIKSDESWSK